MYAMCICAGFNTILSNNNKYLILNIKKWRNIKKMLNRETEWLTANGILWNEWMTINI